MIMQSKPLFYTHQLKFTTSIYEIKNVSILADLAQCSTATVLIMDMDMGSNTADSDGERLISSL